MSTYDKSVISAHSHTLPFVGTRALFLQVLLIVAAVVLPVLAHLAHAPVRYLLPMHWPVLVAGLVYGWRAGTLTGLLAPFVSYMFSGYPLMDILPSMTAELLVYGFVVGMGRERLGLGSFLSLGVALALGRIAFVVVVLLTHTVTKTYAEYFTVALLPGLVAAALQLLLLPFLADWWIKQRRHNRE